MTGRIFDMSMPGSQPSCSALRQSPASPHHSFTVAATDSGGTTS